MRALLRGCVLAFCLSAVFTGCPAPKVAMRGDFDFSKVQRVAVATFSGEHGDVAADFMIHALLAEKAQVVERTRLDGILDELQRQASGAMDPATTREIGNILGVDAFVTGTVTMFSPSQTYLVYTGVTGDPSFSPARSNVASTEAPRRSPNQAAARILTSSALVGLTARLIEVETGSVLWSAHQTYEGFDTDGAMESITSYFAKSLRPIWAKLSAGSETPGLMDSAEK